MKSILSYAGCLLISALVIPSTSTAHAASITGWIEAEKHGDSVGLTAFAKTELEADVAYELRISRQGGSGKATSVQSGRRRLPAGAIGPLSTTSFSLRPGERLEAVLVVRSGECRIEDSLRLSR